MIMVPATNKEQKVVRKMTQVAVVVKKADEISTCKSTIKTKIESQK